MTTGIDTPDRRGRTGLDRAGQDLTGNPDVSIRDVRLLSSHWYVERTTTYSGTGLLRSRAKSGQPDAGAVTAPTGSPVFAMDVPSSRE